MPDADAKKLIEEGRAAYDRRELEVALDKFRTAVDAEPEELDQIDAQRGIGEVLTDLGRYGEARDAYRCTVDLLTKLISEPGDDSELARLFNMRAAAKALSGHLESSIEDFHEALEKAQRWYPQASKSRGRVLLALARYDEARADYRVAVQQLPDDGEAHYGLARVFAASDAREALSEAQEAVRLIGDDKEQQRRSAPLYLLLARAVRAWSGDEAAAEEALQTARTICERDIEERRDCPVARYRLAHVLLELGSPGEAVADFAQAIDLLRSGHAESSSLFAAYAGYGRALSLAGQFDEALGACEKALGLARSREQREDSQANLAYVLSQLGDVDEAIGLIEEARDSARSAGRLTKPGDKKSASTGGREWSILATEGMVRVAAAEKYRDAQSWSAAVGAFEQAVKAAGGNVRPGQKAAYGGMLLAEGYARWHLGDMRGAALAFRKAKDSLPESSVDHFTAENARRSVLVAQSFTLPRQLPKWTVIGVIVVIAVATWLDDIRRLNGGAWVTVVLGLTFLAVASWYLPVITTLKIGGTGFTKEIGIRENIPVIRLRRAPTMADPAPEDILRITHEPGSRVIVPAGCSKVDAAKVDAADASNVRQVFQEAVARAEEIPDGRDAVRRALRDASVYAIGEPAGEVKERQGTKSDLLEYKIDGEQPGEKLVMLPVFTSFGHIQAALLRNPDWQTLSILQLSGEELDANVGDEVHIVIDPWTRDEYLIPSKKETKYA